MADVLQMGLIGCGGMMGVHVEGMKDEAISLALYESSALDQPVEIAKIESCEIEGYQRRFNEQVGL